MSAVADPAMRTLLVGANARKNEEVAAIEIGLALAFGMVLLFRMDLFL